MTSCNSEPCHFSWLTYLLDNGTVVSRREARDVGRKRGFQRRRAARGVGVCAAESAPADAPGSWCADCRSRMVSEHSELASTAALFCIRLKAGAASSAELTTRYRGGAQGGETYEAQIGTSRARCDSCSRCFWNAVHS